MPIVKNGVCGVNRGVGVLAAQRRSPGATRTRRELDTPVRLIAPAHSLTLPALEGVKERFEFSCGQDAALGPAKTLVRRGLVREELVLQAKSHGELLDIAIGDLVERARSGAPDQFGITISITDRIEEYQKPEDILFFIWANSVDSQYIPLRPIFDRLEGNPLRESLMGSLYYWLYCASSRVFDTFGYHEAQNIYGWRKESYREARMNGEDVDLEGEVEAADPAKVVGYIREAHQLLLRGSKARAAMESIADADLRGAFESARRTCVASRRIQLPKMSRECARILHDAFYYMDGEPMPGLGISHWRDDAIVAWFDEFCQQQYESGVNCRAPIILCFRPDDTERFAQIVKALPLMVRTASRLSEWVRFAEEVENASGYRNR